MPRSQSAPGVAKNQTFASGARRASSANSMGVDSAGKIALDLQVCVLKDDCVLARGAFTIGSSEDHCSAARSKVLCRSWGVVHERSNSLRLTSRWLG